MNMKSLLSLMLIALFGAGLVACGGGGTSVGAGGGSGSSGNLVVKVNNGSAFFQSGDQATRVAALVSDFLVEKANAGEPEGHLVQVYDPTGATVIASGETDTSGEVALAVPPNNPGESYFVCFDGASPPDCPTVVVDDGTVVVATATQDATTGDWQLTQDNVVTEPAEDHPEAFQDPEEANNMIICHIPPGNPDAQHTKSIGEPAWQAHDGHGDTIGECPDSPEIVSEDDESEDLDDDEEDDDGEDDTEEAA